MLLKRSCDLTIQACIFIQFPWGRKRCLSEQDGRRKEKVVLMEGGGNSDHQRLLVIAVTLPLSRYR